MRRIADLYPGEAKTDAKDAAVIADAARTMPHTLRSLELTDEITAELTVLVGFDQDLAAEATRTSNRIRGLLTQFHPSLERVLGPRLDHHAVTWLLEPYGSPTGPAQGRSPQTRGADAVPCHISPVQPARCDSRSQRFCGTQDPRWGRPGPQQADTAERHRGGSRSVVALLQRGERDDLLRCRMLSLASRSVGKLVRALVCRNRTTGVSRPPR
jgi:hypothetical protein